MKPIAFPRRSLLAAGLAHCAVNTIGWPRPLFGQSRVLPAAVRTVSVSSNAQLISALSSAQPGDHIVLANGTYSGTFTTSVSGTAANPIVIRAANLLSADISGRIVVNHPYSTVHGLNFTSSTSAGNVRIAADDARVLRCSFTMADAKSASDYTAVEVDTGYKRAEVAYNRTTRGYFAMRVGLAAASTNPAKLNHHFHHNHWKDAGANPLEIGSSWQSSATRTGILIEYNLVENCGNNSSFACKSSENTYFRNTILNCGKRVFQARHGRSNKFIANACINSAGILARGFGHEVIGNYKDAQYPGGNWSDIGAPTGTVRQADFEVNNVPSGTQWPAGDNSLYLGNLPTSRIGGGSSVDTVFPTGNRVESATSSWTLVSGRHVNTTTGTSLSQSVPPYVILKSSDVGPLAD